VIEHFRIHLPIVPLMVMAFGIPALLTAANTVTCAASVPASRQIRHEGMTELIGDLVLSCTGGTAPASGSAISTVDITVALDTNVTSRLLGATGNTTASEALLLIDEPGGSQPPPAPGFGSAAPAILCSSPLGAVPAGCVEYARAVQVNGSPVQVAASSSTGTVNPGANVFQGVVSANQVTFRGIPILAPAAGSTRVLRITNVRANAAGLPGGATAPFSLMATVSSSDTAAVSMTGPKQTAAVVQPGLTATVRDATNSGALAAGGAAISQCTGSNSPVPVAMLRFSENFNSAFLARVAPTSNYMGQSGSPAQNIPGSIYNSESGFVLPAASNNGAVAGLTDYGTRLKAVFSNIPAGIRLFVSVTNLASNTSSPSTVAPAGNSTSSYAALIQGETFTDTNGVPPLTVSSAGVNGTPPTTGVAELLVVNGSATAVWEVINTNPAALENLQFGVWQQFTANAGANSPPPGTATVNLDFAPTFSDSAASAPSGSLPLVRFSDTPSPANLFTVTACQTGCTYTLSGNTSYPGAAASGSVAVTASGGSSCAWTASSAVNWVVITAGATGTGNGNVQFNILANPNNATRSATLTIAGQSFTLTQGAPEQSNLHHHPVFLCRLHNPGPNRNLHRYGQPLHGDWKRDLQRRRHSTQHRDSEFRNRHIRNIEPYCRQPLRNRLVQRGHRLQPEHLRSRHRDHHRRERHPDRRHGRSPQPGRCGPAGYAERHRRPHYRHREHHVQGRYNDSWQCSHEQWRRSLGNFQPHPGQPHPHGILRW
jgi:hypothetical protein